MRCEAQLCLVPRLPPPSSGCSLSEICILGILVTGDGGLASHQQLLCSPAAARPLACVMNAVLGTTIYGRREGEMEERKCRQRLLHCTTTAVC